MDYYVIINKLKDPQPVVETLDKFGTEFNSNQGKFLPVSSGLLYTVRDLGVLEQVDARRIVACLMKFALCVWQGEIKLDTTFDISHTSSLVCDIEPENSPHKLSWIGVSLSFWFEVQSWQKELCRRDDHNYDLRHICNWLVLSSLLMAGALNIKKDSDPLRDMVNQRKLTSRWVLTPVRNMKRDCKLILVTHSLGLSQIKPNGGKATKIVARLPNRPEVKSKDLER